MGDFLYNAPIDKALRLHSNIGDSYLYLFTHKGEKSFGRIQNPTSEITRDSFGVSHMDDLFYIFSTDYDPRPIESASVQASAELVRQIISFSYPNSLYLSLPKYNDGSFVTIPTSRIIPGTLGPNVDDISFWNTMINDIIEITATPPPYFPYNAYEGYKAATWSLVSLFILSLLAVAILVFIIYRKHREEKRSLDFLRVRDKETNAERYIDE